MVRWLRSVTLHLRRFRSRKGRAIASALFCTDPLYFGDIGTLDRSRTYTCPNLNRMSLPIGLREYVLQTWIRPHFVCLLVDCYTITRFLLLPKTEFRVCFLVGRGAWTRTTTLKVKAWCRTFWLRPFNIYKVLPFIAISRLSLASANINDVSLAFVFIQPQGCFCNALKFLYALICLLV